jgi:hypothetical protein
MVLGLGGGGGFRFLTKDAALELAEFSLET